MAPPIPPAMAPARAASALFLWVNMVTVPYAIAAPSIAIGIVIKEEYTKNAQRAIARIATPNKIQPIKRFFLIVILCTSQAVEEYKE